MTIITTSTVGHISTTLQAGTATKTPIAAGNFSALLDVASLGQERDKEAVQTSRNADFLGSIQQFMLNINATLFEIGNSGNVTAAGMPTGLNADGTISVDALLNQGGPLPAFLDRVAARYSLDDAHKQALRNIAIQFKDTAGSPAEVAQIADALKNAGIG